MKHAIVACALVAFAVAAPAAAQGVAGHAQSIGGGIRWAYPVENDTGLSGTPGVAGSWRIWLTPHLGIEAQAGWFTKKMNDEFHDASFSVTTSARLNAYNIGANLLGAVPFGSRAALVLGGGGGLYHEGGTAEAIVNGERSSFSNGRNHFGLQSLAELDVRASDRMSIFGGLHAEWRDVKEGIMDASVIYPVAGVRFMF